MGDPILMLNSLVSPCDFGGKICKIFILGQRRAHKQNQGWVN